MAKPKKKRDLRARLGKTITPKTRGKGGVVKPPIAGGTPGPNLGGATPAQPGGIAAPPAGGRPGVRAGGGVARPPAGIGSKSSGVPGADLAPPPFARAAPEPEPEAGDPFAAQESAVPQQVVRLEFDDALVKDSEVGKTKRFMIFLVAGIGLAGGAVIGMFAGSTYETKQIFDRTVRDGQQMNVTVEHAEATLLDAQRLVQRARAAANPSDGTTSVVDYDAMTELRALSKPFELHDFTSRNYSAFPTVADPLIRYANLVQELWDELRILSGETLRADAREELDRTAAAAGSIQQIGAVLAAGDGVVEGSLVYVENTDELTEEGDHPQILVRSRRGAQAHPFRIYTGGEEETLEATPVFVLNINEAQSQGVLGELGSAFRSYLEHLIRIETMITGMIELQGTVIAGLHRGLTDVGADLLPPEGAASSESAE